MERLKNIFLYIYAIADKVKEFFLRAFQGIRNYFSHLKHISKEGTPAQKKELKTNLIFLVVVLVMLAGITVMCISRWNQEFSYTKSLNETLFVFEDKEVKLRDVTYYIMIEEEAVNETAQEYDPKNVNSYWNLHLNEGYVSEQAKETALNYCVRDVIYAYRAKEAGLELQESKKAELVQKAKNIYEGLTEKQLEAGLTEEDIYIALCNNQLADDWVLLLAKRDGLTISERVLSAYYGMNSYFFDKTLAEADYVLNQSLWDEVSLGNLTIN